MNDTFDCIVCGSCVLDILIRPVPLTEPIGEGTLVDVEPIEVAPGGIVSNAGIALARLGMNVAAMSYVGDDEWGELLRRRCGAEGIEIRYLIPFPDIPSSVTAAMIAEDGQRSFIHCVGAPKRLDKVFFLDRLDAFARSRFALFGYYPLMPSLLEDLAEVMAAIRQTGCRTALDAAGDGGTMQPLERILPHLDLYCPSREEAAAQTGRNDPREILAAYRGYGAPGILGVKLGSQGALLSPAADQFVEIEPVEPPGEVVDTTGAGDTFYAGLLAGLLRGFSAKDAGRLAAAAGACCITGVGATAAIRNFDETVRLAGLDPPGNP